MIGAWCAAIEPRFYELTGRSPLEFAALTLVEIMQLVEAAERRRATHEYELSILGCWLLAPWSKKRLKPEKLLKPRAPAAPVRHPDWPPAGALPEPDEP